MTRALALLCAACGAAPARPPAPAADPGPRVEVIPWLHGRALLGRAVLATGGDDDVTVAPWPLAPERSYRGQLAGIDAGDGVVFVSLAGDAWLVRRAVAGQDDVEELGRIARPACPGEEGATLERAALTATGLVALTASCRDEHWLRLLTFTPAGQPLVAREFARERTFRATSLLAPARDGDDVFVVIEPAALDPAARIDKARYPSAVSRVSARTGEVRWTAEVERAFFDGDGITTDAAGDLFVASERGVVELAGATGRTLATTGAPYGIRALAVDGAHVAVVASYEGDDDAAGTGGAYCGVFLASRLLRDGLGCEGEALVFTPVGTLLVSP